MSAHPGNKYAEKWTYERTFEALRSLEHHSSQDSCLYLGQALSYAGLYDDVWRYWCRKWKNKPEVINLMKMILQRFEARIFQKMATREMPVNAGMFALNHHYGWGRAAREEQSDDELDYVDQIPVPPPFDEAMAQREREKTQARPPRAEAPAIPNPILTRLMVDQYNLIYSDDPIRTPVTYMEGDPPAGMSAIMFDRGYFLKTG